MATHIYGRHNVQHSEEFETISEALRSAYWGEEGGWIFSERVIDDDGETIYDYVKDGNIFDFCEERGYEWVADQ